MRDLVLNGPFPNGPCWVLLGLVAAALVWRLPWRSWAFELSGEENTLAQARGVLQVMSNVTRQQPSTRPDVPVRHIPTNRYGVNTFLEQEVEPEKRERSMQLIAEAGFGWIRQEFPWADIEISAKGDFWDHKWEHNAWDKYDHIVALAEKYDVKIMARLTSPPAWSRADGHARGAFAPPDDFEDYADFVEAVVRRYGTRLGAVQIWNEPNVTPEWGDCPACGVDPEAYTRLLCAAYQRAKSVDPDVVIVSGALAQTITLNRFPPDGGINDIVFLQRMYQAGAGECFDVLSANDYGLGSGPSDRRMRFNHVSFARPVYLRDVMVNNGDTHKPIWISEMNWNAVPGPLAEDAAWYRFGQVTPQQQAEYLVRAYRRIEQEWPWVGVGFTWFFKRPSNAEKGQSFYYFRLLEADFTPLPAYEAFKRYARDGAGD
ncbi:MAG: cellulase family glycosylhydrolase [Thermoflexales bacterium]|nr:cellulase family glycosylhydrolase [Thermoflexales bacterium]